MYTKSRFKITRLIKVKDCTEMNMDPDYIGKIFGLRYKLNADDKMGPKR